MSCVIFHSAKIMMNYLLELGLPMPMIQQCPYSQDIAGQVFVIRMEDLTDGDPGQEASFRMLASRYTSSEITMSEDLSSYQKKGVAGDFLTRLIPAQKDGPRSFSRLMFICWGQEKFRYALDSLFRLGVENARSIKVQHGDSELFLGFVPTIKTPTLLAKLAFASGIRVFYPVFSDNYGVWMEWGWKCDFSDPLFYRVFQGSDAETVFILKDGNKISIPVGLSAFIPLAKFMKLKYSMRSQTALAEVREFRTPELEFKLSLKRDTFRDSRKAEMERLHQEKREIEERIEWLQDIEAVFKEEASHKAFFYPLADSMRDPIFPRAFIRHYSLSQLRKIKIFHGNLGTLGPGVLVCGKDLIACTPGSLLHIPGHLYPKRGMIFQSNPPWMSKAGLRVMTPEGFDLFPYLDVDSDDRKVIVNSFLDEAVWGVTQTPTVPLKTKPEASLRELAEAVKNSPEKHLFFIFPRQDRHNPDWEACPLEGIIIKEEDFRDFEVKMANIGVNFAMEESEREIVGRDIRETVARNVMDRFNLCVSQIRIYLEQSYLKERAAIRDEIMEFDKNIENKRQALQTHKEKLAAAMASILQKEGLIVRYEDFLNDIVSRYTSLVEAGANDAGHFLESLETMFIEAGEAFSIILAECDQQTGERLKNLSQLKSDKVDKVAEETDKLMKKRTAAFAAIEDLKNFQGKTLEERKEQNWDRLALLENVKELWGLVKAVQGLESFLSQVESHIREAKLIVYRNQAHAPVAKDHAAHAATAVEWLDKVIKRLNSHRQDLEQISGHQPKFAPSQMETQAMECLAKIEESLSLINKRKEWHQGKMKLHKSTLEHIEQLRTRLDKLRTNIG